MLLLVFAGAALGEGTYQRTKDGKTIVWNNDPKPGDTATWFGDRDGEGYATKIGTLTWYTANGALYARYFGNMVRGKFDGMVNVHSKGKTGHAIFVDGQRTTRWAAGRAPSWRVAQWPARRPAKPPMKMAGEENAERRTPNVQRPTEDTQAEGSPSSRNRGSTARQAPNSESFPEQAAQPPIQDTPAKELSEQRAPPAKPAAAAEPASAEPSDVAEPEAPAEGPRNVGGAENVQRPTSNAQRPIENVPAKEISEQEGEQPATPSSESFREQAAQLPMEDMPSVLIQPSKESVPAPPTSKKSEAKIEDSLQSLAQPPLSILAIPETAGSPEASPRLTKEEVISIANAKARTHGYNRADYQRAEPQYNAAYKIWSVSYEQSTADAMEEAGKHFSVIVDDKTKGTVFLLRR